LQRLTLTLLWLATLLHATVVSAESFHIRLVLSDNSEPYQKFSSTFSRTLSADNAVVVVTESLIVEEGSDLIVAVGSKATELAISSSNSPVLSVMVPRSAYDNMLTKRANKDIEISAIYLDQPWERQVDFLNAALPEYRRVGLLYSSGRGLDINLIRQIVTGHGGTLIAKQTPMEGSIFSSLEHVLESSDVLLAIPDNTIYNARNIRNILLTSYRLKVPLIGLSQSYVNAGAIAAIFSTPDQLARQSAKSALQFIKNGKLPVSQYPTEFSIGVNLQVAKSLGVDLPAPEKIRGQMLRDQEDGGK